MVMYGDSRCRNECHNGSRMEIREEKIKRARFSRKTFPRTTGDMAIKIEKVLTV